MKVQTLCDKLVANDATLTQLRIPLYVFNEDYDESRWSGGRWFRPLSDAELKEILDAAKKNKTVKKVLVDGAEEFKSLNVPSSLSLASIVLEHPEIQAIVLDHINVIEFGPIALAIQQNRKLNHLKFYWCQATPNLIDCIRWLLTENALESMTLNNMTSGEGESFDISGALLGNSSLRKLVLCDDNSAFGPDPFQLIPQMIQTNQDFEVIDLSLRETITDRFDLVRLIAQAAEGHASLNKLAIDLQTCRYQLSAEDVIHHVGSARAIGTMLHNAPALRELSLKRCYMGSAGAHHLADGLSSKNCIVEKLDLSWSQLGTEEAGIIARLLSTNQKLKSLALKENNIRDFGAFDLALALSQNNTLEFLDLGFNRIGRHGASALAYALVMNEALTELNLLGNIIGDDGATSIAEMLTRNKSIGTVRIGGFEEQGRSAFVTRLPQMSSVKTIEFRCVDAGVASEIGNALVQALEQNTKLETFDFKEITPPYEAVPQVKHLLALNRGGRRLLSATGESVPPLNYWPRILARSSTNHMHNADVLFYFLREIPNVLVAKAGSREHKRSDDDDETNSSTVHHI